MGRKAKPVELMLLQGTKHLTKKEIEQRKKAEEKFKPKTDKIKCPSWLDKVAKKEFRRLVKELQEVDLITNVDINALALYCDAYSKYRQANKEIEERGMFVEYTNKAGATNIIENPAIKVANKYSEIMRKISSEFGLTPSARAKLALPREEEKEVTEFDRMFGDV